MASVAGGEISVVLVHGGFVDESGWEKVYQILKKDGYAVSIVQNPTRSLADDVAFTNLATLIKRAAQTALAPHTTLPEE